MKTTKFWVVAATMFLLQIAENSNASQKQSFTYHYTREVGKPRPDTLPNEELMLTFSPEAIKKTREYVYSLPWTLKDDLFHIYIGEWHRKHLFESHTKQTIETDPDGPDVLECIKIFKNKPKVEELPGSRSFEVELYRVNNIQFDRALSEIDAIGKLQNKKVILHIKTTSIGLLDILQYFDNSKEIISNYHALQVIKFIPVREDPFDIEQVKHWISPIEGIQFKFEPYTLLKGNSNQLQIAMFIDPNDGTSSFPSSFDFFNEHLSQHAAEYCDTLASIKAKKKDEQETIEQQIAETPVEKASLDENERIAGEEALKKAGEIEIQKKRERIAEEQRQIEQARKDDDFWKKESARQKKEEKEEEAAEQALRNSTQAEVNKKGKKIAEEQSQSEQAQKEAELNKLAELEKQLAEKELLEQEKATHEQKQIEHAAKIAEEKAKKEAEAEEKHKKALEKASEDEKQREAYAKEARQKFETMMKEYEAQKPGISNNSSTEKKEQASTIKSVFSYRPVQFALALIALANVYHFFITSEQKDTLSSFISHYWEKLSHFSPSLAGTNT